MSTQNQNPERDGQPTNDRNQTENQRNQDPTRKGQDWNLEEE